MPRLTQPFGGSVSVRSRTIGIAGGCLALAFGVAACGSDDNSSSGGGGGGGSTVDIYSSLPLQGASKDQTAAMVNGMKLALSEAGNKAGNLKGKETSLDDSTAPGGKWDPGPTPPNARKVPPDSQTAY